MVKRLTSFVLSLAVGSMVLAGCSAKVEAPKGEISTQENKAQEAEASEPSEERFKKSKQIR